MNVREEAGKVDLVNFLLFLGKFSYKKANYVCLFVCLFVRPWCGKGVSTVIGGEVRKREREILSMTEVTRQVFLHNYFS